MIRNLKNKSRPLHDDLFRGAVCDRQVEEWRLLKERAIESLEITKRTQFGAPHESTKIIISKGFATFFETERVGVPMRRGSRSRGFDWKRSDAEG